MERLEKVLAMIGKNLFTVEEIFQEIPGGQGKDKLKDFPTNIRLLIQYSVGKNTWSMIGELENGCFFALDSWCDRTFYHAGSIKLYCSDDLDQLRKIVNLYPEPVDVDKLFEEVKEIMAPVSPVENKGILSYLMSFVW